MMSRRLNIAMLLLLGISTFTPLAWAHGINLFATVAGTSVSGTLVYADGTPARAATIHAFAPDGTVIGEASTDDAGRFSFQARYHCRHRLVGDVGQGHRGLFTIPEEELPDSLPSFGASGTAEARSEANTQPVSAAQAEAPLPDHFDERLDASLARQLRPLREQLNRYETTIRLRDVMGGIGYLFGLAGMFALLKSRKNRPAD